MKIPWIPEPGTKYGRLTVRERTRRVGRGYWQVECSCQCGDVLFVTATCLRTGNTSSCGCLHRERTRDRLIRHGGSDTSLHKTWMGIRQRCNNPGNTDYEYYGGRGIAVCDEWLDFAAFGAWAHANGYDDSLTIDRIDGGGSYSPENCRWVDRKTQARNRRSNTLLSAFGETKLLIEWVEDSRCVVGVTTLSSRVNKLAWDHEHAIATPAGSRA